MFPYEDSKTVSACPFVSVCPSVCLYPEWRSHHSFVNIIPALVIDTSMERSSRVLHHANSKICKKISKKFEIRILTCDEDMHLHDDIGDASSSFWGSTSSFLFLRPCLIHARMPDCGRSFVHGHTFLHSWSGPMTLVVGLLHGATFLHNLLLFSSCLL